MFRVNGQGHHSVCPNLWDLNNSLSGGRNFLLLSWLSERVVF